MDESFRFRARRLLDGSEPAPLEYGLLKAALAAQAAASEAARAQARAAPPPAEPIGEIVLAGSAWKEAASAQRGCFNRAEVRRRLNVP
ncbi:MAG TPA: hypothetical protein VGW40_03925 [Allosphingosinicella sp.]|nr:hypothetical protein [Allosphingosinicella sp.]